MGGEDGGGSEGQAGRVPIGVLTPPRQGADFLEVHRTRILSKPLTRGIFPMGNLVLQATLPFWNGKGRSLHRALVTVSRPRPRGGVWEA